MNKKHEQFAAELKSIQNEAIRGFTQDVLNQIVPDYFYEVPASSTGKHHPQISLGEGGLVRHTKAAVRIAMELRRNETVSKFQPLTWDMIISALILHDTFKHGAVKAKYTVPEHPKVAAGRISEFIEYEMYPEEDKKLFRYIPPLILTHMGQWNTAYNSKKELMPKPATAPQRFVHLCDYIASRKYIASSILD